MFIWILVISNEDGGQASTYVSRDTALEEVFGYIMARWLPGNMGDWNEDDLMGMIDIYFDYHDGMESYSLNETLLKGYKDPPRGKKNVDGEIVDMSQGELNVALAALDYAPAMEVAHKLKTNPGTTQKLMQAARKKLS